MGREQITEGPGYTAQNPRPSPEAAGRQQRGTKEMQTVQTLGPGLAASASCPAAATEAERGCSLPNKTANFTPKCSTLSNFQNSIKIIRETSIFSEISTQDDDNFKSLDSWVVKVVASLLLQPSSGK